MLDEHSKEVNIPLTEEEMEWVCIALSVMSPAKCAQQYMQQYLSKIDQLASTTRFHSEAQILGLLKSQFARYKYHQHLPSSQKIQRYSDRLWEVIYKYFTLFPVFCKYECWTLLQEMYYQIIDSRLRPALKRVIAITRKMEKWLSRYEPNASTIIVRDTASVSEDLPNNRAARQNNIVPRFSHAEKEWLRLALSIMSPKRAVPIFMHRFMRHAEIADALYFQDQNITEDAAYALVEDVIRKRFYDHKNDKTRPSYAIIQENMQELQVLNSRYYDIYPLLMQIEEYIYLQELFLNNPKIPQKGDADLFRLYLFRDAERLRSELLED